MLKFVRYNTNKKQNKYYMKNNYATENTVLHYPKKETIEFLLNYSKKLSDLELNGLLNKRLVKLKEN